MEKPNIAACSNNPNLSVAVSFVQAIHREMVSHVLYRPPPERRIIWTLCDREESGEIMLDVQVHKQAVSADFVLSNGALVWIEDKKIEFSVKFEDSSPSVYYRKDESSLTATQVANAVLNILTSV